MAGGENHFFSEKLHSWYDENKEIYHGVEGQNPYHIWVSKLCSSRLGMDTVIPYYERFLDLFPTVESLANAPEERLLKAWEGLGIILEFVICERLQPADYD